MKGLVGQARDYLHLRQEKILDLSERSFQPNRVFKVRCILCINYLIEKKSSKNRGFISFLSRTLFEKSLGAWHSKIGPYSPTRKKTHFFGEKVGWLLEPPNLKMVSFRQVGAVRNNNMYSLHRFRLFQDLRLKNPFSLGWDFAIPDRTFDHLKSASQHITCRSERWAEIFSGFKIIKWSVW